MWRISKFFQIPLNDQRMQDLNSFDLEFYELSMIADDPKKLEQLQNHYYDPDFDDWLEEFEAEQEELQSKQDKKSGESEQLDMPDEETIEWVDKTRSSQQKNDSDIYEEDYDVSVPTDEISDWEEVN